jgi:hypothetical protein
MNQFAQTLSRGFVIADGGIRSVEGILANTDAEQITSCGDLVKLVEDTNATGVRNFAEVSQDDNTGYGFVKKVLKQTQYKTGNNISVARNFDVIVGIANVNINSGDVVYYITTDGTAPDPSANGKGKITNIAPNSTTTFGIKAGIAISTAEVGKLVKFEINLGQASDATVNVNLITNTVSGAITGDVVGSVTGTVTPAV